MTTKKPTKPRRANPTLMLDCHPQEYNQMGYVEYMNWCEEQTKLGREQKQCETCRRWYWPALDATESKKGK